MPENNLKFSTDKLEPLILANCVLNPSYFMKFKKFLFTEGNKTYFNDKKYQKIFNIYCKYYDLYSKLPTEKTLLTIVDKLNDEQEIKDFYFIIINDMFNIKHNDINEEFIETETIDFIKETRVYEAMMEAQVDIDNKDYSLIVEKMGEAVRVNFDKDLGKSIKDIKENINEINETSVEKVISTGYANFDAMLDGGFKPKTLTVFSALPGAGKSLFMGNLALNAFYDGHNALFYTFEMSYEKVIMRYYQNMANMAKTEALLHEEEFETKLNNLTSKIEGDLIVKEYNSNSANANDLMAHINDLRVYKKWVPHIIFIDYILIMGSTEKGATSSANSNLFYKRISEDIRNMGKTLEVPIISAIQINREGMSDKGGSKAIVTAKDISASRGVYDTADYFGIMAQTKKDRENNRFMLLTDKNREGDISSRLEFKINYELMRVEEGAIITK